jgi:cell division protein FtsL
MILVAIFGFICWVAAAILVVFLHWFAREVNVEKGRQDAIREYHQYRRR